jgi:hypothetical protein
MDLRILIINQDDLQVFVFFIVNYDEFYKNKTLHEITY